VSVVAPALAKGTEVMPAKRKILTAKTIFADCKDYFSMRNPVPLLRLFALPLSSSYARLLE
jgi:hypothetical protein